MLLLLALVGVAYAEPVVQGEAAAVEGTLPLPASKPATPPQPAEWATLRQQKPQPLPPELVAILQKHHLPAEQFSLHLRDLHASAPLAVLNPEVPRNPASVMKLLTTWAALKLLGPNYMWKTEVWARGEVKDGTLHGDLLLKGYGDPFLTDEAFRQLLHDLQLKGVRRITGNLLVDNSYFQVPEYDPGAFDGEPTRVYNAPPAALMFNFHASRLLLEPTPDGKVGISPFPLIPGLQLQNSMVLARGRCSKQHYKPDVVPEGGAMRVKGTYAADCGKAFVLRVLSKPEEHIFNAFRDVWRSLGGEFQGTWQRGQVQTGDVLLHTHDSRTLGEQIRFINKWSNNVMTRNLFLTIGAERLGAPGTLDKSRIAVADLLAKTGIDYRGLLVENGSGLSRVERISAKQLGLLLEAAWRDPYMPEFVASLPLLGVDGTLAKRFDGTDLEGRAHLKTGTLDDVSSLAGYLLTRSGKRFVVVMIQNGKNGHGVQDAILEWLFEQ